MRATENDLVLERLDTTPKYNALGRGGYTTISILPCHEVGGGIFTEINEEGNKFRRSHQREGPRTGGNGRRY